MSPRAPELTRREVEAVVDKLIAGVIDTHDGLDGWMDFCLAGKCADTTRRRIKRAFRERIARYRARRINL